MISRSTSATLYLHHSLVLYYLIIFSLVIYIFYSIPNRSINYRDNKEMTSEDRCIKVGPGQMGCHYANCQYFDLRGCNEISQIFVSGGEDGIESIQFQYVEKGKYVLSDQYGNGSLTTIFHTIELNHPAEYITEVNGLYNAGNNIRVITFTTNIQKYGPFGEKNPDQQHPDLRSFTYNLGKSCQFGGFHGSYSGYSLLSLGVYLLAKAVPPSVSSKTPKKKTQVVT